MTPDEVVENLIEYGTIKALSSNEGSNDPVVVMLQSAISLIQDYQKLRERVSKEKILKIIEDNLECKDDDVIGCHINGKNASAQAIVTYLQQPTEHIAR